MPSDPPAAPSRGRACPPRAGRAAPGGLLGIARALCCLARLPTAPACPAPGCEPGQNSPKGRGRILLVDDETNLLDLVCQALEPLGYQAAAHNLPEAALQASLASPQSFDLVLTDQSMPRLTGLQLATRLREVRMDLPTIVCTGYSMAVPPDRFQALGQAWLLSKPFTRAEMLRAVERALTP